MKYLNALAFILFSMSWLLSNLSYANSNPTEAEARFNDAVNRYLDGFEYCTQAKEALRQGDTNKAQQDFANYKAIKSEAASIDKRILSSDERGMDSNLMYCQRIAIDLEIALGTPLLEDAFSECDKVKNSLQEGDETLAKSQFEAFQSLKEKAITSAPNLENVFSAKNKIWQCERLEEKIAQLSTQQQALEAAINKAKTESTAYSALCQKALNELNNEGLKRESLSRSNAKLNQILPHKQLSKADAKAWKALQQPERKAQRAAIEADLAKGDQCVKMVKNSINAKLIQIGAIELNLNSYANTLKSGSDQCKKITQLKLNHINQASYDQARLNFDSAMRTRNRVRAEIKTSQHYQAHSNWPQAKRIKENLQQLNVCLDGSEIHLNKLALALRDFPAERTASTQEPASTADQSSVRASNLVPEVQSIHATSNMIQGSITMKDKLPSFALIYLLDGSVPPADVEVILDEDGFNKQFYIAAQGDDFTIKSKVYGRHRITAEIPNMNFTADITQLLARQSRQGKVSWPENTIATLRSNRGDIAPTYMASIPSGNYQLIPLEDSHFSFKLNNPNRATKGYVLLPGYDPLEIDVTKAELNSLVITQNEQPRGNLQIKTLQWTMP